MNEGRLKLRKDIPDEGKQQWEAVVLPSPTTPIFKKQKHEYIYRESESLKKDWMLENKMTKKILT